MAQEKLLDVSGIAEELNTGPATIKFLLKRFKKWLPFESAEGHQVYEYSTLQTLIRIQDFINSGLLPSEIEDQLDAKIGSGINDLENQFKTLSNGDDIRLSHDGLSLLKSLFQDIGNQQKRIAEAHEKRAHAEERKAVAIEKRAEAEEKKAEAMNNIASALQEMNQVRSSDVQTSRIVQKTASILVSDSIDSDPVDSERGGSGQPEKDNLFDEIEDLDSFSEDVDTSDLLEDEALMDDENLLDEFTEPDPLMNDLENNFTDELADSLEDESSDVELDDLSSLIDDDPDIDIDDIDIDDIDIDINNIGLEIDDIDLDFDDAIDEEFDEEFDDLSKLINDTNPDNIDEVRESEPLDDLSLLVESDSDSNQIKTNDETSSLDDLSALIDSPDENSRKTQSEEEQVVEEPSEVLDDLSLLLDEPNTADESNESESISDTINDTLDDLASLLDDDTKADTAADNNAESNQTSQLDDLSKLINDPDESSLDSSTDPPESAKPDASSTPQPKTEIVPEIKMDITPEEDVKKYKAAIMQVILGLKNEGLSPQEATERLNRNNIKTISGKPEWSDKAISQIYTFIESAK